MGGTRTTCCPVFYISGCLTGAPPERLNRASPRWIAGASPRWITEGPSRT
ncbi:hypothetical protein J1N35_044259 [Gossypium stocksii]|uniref:Uncharacterized protein n=1 Tax=Gossypium stocksii TaxID=47602 RepID=A0A9D3U912_9ROSI|nr:hypothetical protein J1N35_044259 [Gossypium stocksii]